MESTTITALFEDDETPADKLAKSQEAEEIALEVILNDMIAED